jgi:hypothetical protein
MNLRPSRRKRSGVSFALVAMLLTSSSVAAGAMGVTARDAGSRVGTGAGDQLANNAVAAMKQVRAVHSSGTFGAPRAGSTFTGVCAMSEPRARMSFHGGLNYWQKIFISKPKKDWERHRVAGGPWSPWQAQPTGPGDFNFPLVLPLACPRISLYDWRSNGTLHFQVSGVVSIGSRQAWHLRATIPGSPSPTIVDWYVDKGTYRLIRRLYTTHGNAGYVEDASYSAFNAHVTVNPPRG